MVTENKTRAQVKVQHGARKPNGPPPAPNKKENNNKMYDIVIDYTTGDSFGSERIEDEPVGIVVSSLEVAKENLKRIQEHYEKYNKNYSHEQYQLELLTDEKPRMITPFWIGYFETLHGAKIVQEEELPSFTTEYW